MKNSRKTSGSGANAVRDGAGTVVYQRDKVVPSQKKHVEKPSPPADDKSFDSGHFENVN